MLPVMIPVRQRFAAEPVVDLVGAMRAALDQLPWRERVQPGMRVGIPAGSRGIRQIPLILGEAVRYLRMLGAEPVVVAAMGSHGGGTPDGQTQVLRSLGITPERVGAPVLADGAAQVVGEAADGSPVYCDSHLAACDGILVINRIKPHTSFHGSLESGLSKMLVVGCGKAAGAALFHSYGPPRLSARLRDAVQILLERLPVVGGVGIIEDQQEQTAAVEPVQTDRWIAAEEILLERARRLVPGLPFPALDVLVVDVMGKNISGTGMDTGVIGRMGIRGMAESGPAIERIVVLDLSEGSHGNANGVGLADFVTKRLAEKIDFAATYLNSLTTGLVERAKLPITLESDRAAIEGALRTLGSPSAPRLARIENTLHLERMLVSPAVLQMDQAREALVVVGEGIPWPFDAAGNLFG